MRGYTMRMRSATVAVDLVPKITTALGCRIPTQCPSRGFELFLPGSPSIINDIPSVFYIGWVSSGVLLSLAASGVFSKMIGRRAPT